MARGGKFQIGKLKVTVYARHGADCPQKNDATDHSSCNCVKWFQCGADKKCTHEWNWNRAEKFAREEARPSSYQFFRPSLYEIAITFTVP